MAPFKLWVNGRQHPVDVDPDTPLLWVLRDSLGMTGTKFGCGVGQCGACLVHLDGEAMRSCTMTVAEVGEARITTIEGLSPDGAHPVQRAWERHQVVQCGWCQPGQIMAAAALLARNPDPSDADIDRGMRDVLCRCGTYPRIRRALHDAAKEVRK